MRTMRKFGVLSGIALCLLCLDVTALKVVRIIVPEAVERGKDAILKCFFNLEGEKLYAVKWYRGPNEFYRYTPKEDQPIRQFKIMDKMMNVRETESNESQVVLEHVSREISGPFSCEVTADQPSFFTDIQTANLTVVDLPHEDPHISGLKNHYRLDDIIKANCTSSNSNPPANLTWYINGFPMDVPQVQKHKPILHDGKFYISHSTIRLRVVRDLFENGRMKVRCAASIYDVYHRSFEKSVELREKRKHHRAHQAHQWKFISSTPPVYVHQIPQTSHKESPPTFGLDYIPLASNSGSPRYLPEILLVTSVHLLMERCLR